MSLPTKTIVDDIVAICSYLATKPTGATLKEAGAVIDTKYIDPRKIAALKGWSLIEDMGGKWKVTTSGRAFARGSAEDRKKLLRAVVAQCQPYNAIVERATHRASEEAVNSPDVAAHWHSHFKQDAAASDDRLNDQALCFFHLAQGAGLGTVVLGRKGSPTRLEWDRSQFSLRTDTPESADDQRGVAESDVAEATDTRGEQRIHAGVPAQPNGERPGLAQGIFLAHGKNKKPLEQLKKILGEFNIPFKVAVDEPNLGRPISGKIRETMQLCNCAILIFTADERFRNDDDKEIWRPSENVVYELGACSYLYENRVVVVKEDKVDFPSNFRDLGYISFADGGLDAKAMDIIKELIGFGIVKVST